MDFMKITLENSVHYYAESFVHGHLVIATDTPKMCENVAINLLGKASVQWSTEEDLGFVKLTRTYTNRAVYVNARVLLWSKDRHPTGEMEAGEHNFPFQFRLPQGSPPTYESDYANVRYELEAKFTPKTQERNFTRYTVKQMLVVRAREETLRFYMTPKTAEIFKVVGFSWMNLGSVTLSVTLACTGYASGKSIPISVSVNNQSSRRLRVCAALKRKETISSSNHQSLSTSNIAIVSGPSVPAREAAFSDNLILDIPHDVYSTIKECTCRFINVEYFVAVKIKIPWSINKSVKIPIVIS